MNKFDKFFIFVYPSLRKSFKENLKIHLEKQHKNLKMELLALKLAENEPEIEEIDMVQEKFLT